MHKGRTTRMVYYDLNQHTFTQKETTKQPSSMLHFHSKGKHKSSNTTRRKMRNFELKMILTWMRWKEWKRFEENVHLDGLMLLPNGVPCGFWVMKLLSFEEKWGEIWFHPLFFTPFFMPLSDAHSPRRVIFFLKKSYNPVISFIITYKS